MSVVLKMVSVLLCAVFVSAAVMPTTDFDLEKMVGKWYITGMATNAEWFVSHKAHMKMGTAMLVSTEDGDLDISFAILQDDGSCWRTSHRAKKTETPGYWEKDKDLHVIDVRFDEYSIIQTKTTQEGVSQIFNTLNSRNTTLAEDVVEKFRKFSLDTGILAENVLILPPNGECSVA